MSRQIRSRLPSSACFSPSLLSTPCRVPPPLCTCCPAGLGQRGMKGCPCPRSLVAGRIWEMLWSSVASSAVLRGGGGCCPVEVCEVSPLTLNSHSCVCVHVQAAQAGFQLAPVAQRRRERVNQTSALKCVIVSSAHRRRVRGRGWSPLRLQRPPTCTKSCRVCVCFSPERSRCSQPGDGQHAAQRRHARRTHAPGLLSSKAEGSPSLRPSLTPAHFHPSHASDSFSAPPITAAKPILLSPPPFLASLAVLIPVQMCSLFCLSSSVPYVQTLLVNS